MEDTFTADEVFEMAETIERNGSAFYRKIADRADAAAKREMLLRLADMEDEHEGVFARLRAGAGGREEGAFVDPDGTAAAYLRSIADGYVFDVREDPAEKLTGEETLEEILRTAIALEKDSIVFYVGLRMVVPKDLGKEHLTRIIREEMGHIATLRAELDAL
jgi:rubrerythrin